jgi:hypothetical protein
MFNMPILTGDDKKDLRTMINTLDEWSRTLKRFIKPTGIDGAMIDNIERVNITDGNLDITLDVNGLIITHSDGVGVFKIIPYNGSLGVFLEDSNDNTIITTSSTGNITVT